MVNTFVAIGLGAVIALSPLAAMAQSDGPMQVAQAAPATPNSAHAGGGGSQGEGEGGSGTHAPDAHGAGRAQELITSS
jgi:hypothetical protein